MIIFFKSLLKLPKAICWWVLDLIRYVRYKLYRNFDRWGLHLFVGKFGAGKTSTMVWYAHLLAKQYKTLTVLTNLHLRDFPKHTKIRQLNTIEDILSAPSDTLVLIDEIGTIFNSRDFVSGKGSIPKHLFQHLCQCRKRRMMIWGTVQRYNFLDKQLRDITDTVYVTRCIFGHPFSRLVTVRRYDAAEYDVAHNNPLLPLPILSGDVYIQTDRLRSMYQTDELIETFLDKDPSEFMTDEEVMESRGETPIIFTAEGNGKKRKKRRKFAL